jgi:hypothetical protein
MMISSKKSPPNPPSFDEEVKHIIQHELELFGIVPKMMMPDSNIIKDEGHCRILHDWLKEDDSDGELSLLDRGSRDGLSNEAFHLKCGDKGCTLTIIETTDGHSGAFRRVLVQQHKLECGQQGLLICAPFQRHFVSLQNEAEG